MSAHAILVDFAPGARRGPRVGGALLAAGVALLGLVLWQGGRLVAERGAAQAALQHDPRLSSVVLVSHQVQAQAPGTPIRFQVQAQWGDTP